MNIYINYDTFKQDALIIRDKVIKISSNMGIEIVEDINDADIICSIGGDGTFLESSKLSQKPIFGINCGTLGYLTEVEVEDIEEALENIIDNKYYIEERMMLDAQIIKTNGDKIKIQSALNEIAISKNSFGVIRFDTIIDDTLINSYTADGILICTPTGSTAYNLSCGGPIVDPAANIITLTPIAPHTILNRSIVLSEESDINIKINELRTNVSAYVLSDGKATRICENDIVNIKKSRQKTQIIKFNKNSFVDTIRKNIN